MSKWVNDILKGVKLTKQEADDLSEVLTWDEDSFPEILEEHTGLQAKPARMFLVFDAAGDYVGNTQDDTVNDILRKAGIEVIEGG